MKTMPILDIKLKQNRRGVHYWVLTGTAGQYVFHDNEIGQLIDKTIQVLNFTVAGEHINRRKQESIK